MPIINAYTIGFWTTGSELVATLLVDATSKKQADEMGREIGEELLPILQIHYNYIGLVGPTRLKVMVTRQRPAVSGHFKQPKGHPLTTKIMLKTKLVSKNYYFWLKRVWKKVRTKR